MSYTFEFPVQYFPDPTIFGALGLGSLYVGVPNGNPATVSGDRIQVYAARQGLSDLAISQPISISAGGVPLYNGSPVTLKVLAPYSVQALDYLGVMVYNSPHGGDEISEFIAIDARIDALDVLIANKVGTVATFAALASTAATADGLIVETVCHTSGKIGGKRFVSYSATHAASDNGSHINSATAGRRWAAMDTEDFTLYHFGGTLNGTCVAAMDYFLASAIDKIKVPDNVTLGNHGWSATKKIIIGGNAVTFTGASAGFRPVDIEYLEISGFTNIVMSSTVADGHQFFAPGSLADHGVVRITGNSGGGGIGGVIASYENSRTIREIFILDNDFNDQVGEDGGQGYGVQYANENTTGECWIERNKITRAGRHSFYVARNAGGRVRLNNNKAINHRENSTVTRGALRPAYNFGRGLNISGYGNEVDGYYDGAFAYEWENENPPSPLYADNITLYNTIIRNPKNILASISYGLQTPNNNALRGVRMFGVEYYSDAIAAPLFSYNYGHDLIIDDIYARFANMPAGSFRLGVITADSATNSTNHYIGRANVYIENSAAATFQAYRLAVGTCTAQIKTVFGRLTYTSSAGSNATFSTATSIDNLLIELEPGIDEDGLSFNSGKYLARTTAKSAGFNGRQSAASLTTPVGTFVPQFFGEMMYLSDAGAKSFWMANGLTNADWVKLGP